MKKIKLMLFLFCCAAGSYSQNSPDTLAAKQNETAADDPSQFITRTEFFNELQYHRNDNSNFYLNQTIFRMVAKIGKRFTMRLDVPYVYNSFSTPAKYDQSGVGDISFRILGYRFFQSNKTVITGSLECGLNTAQSPLLGLGKNLLIPMITYTTKLPKQKMLLAVVLQQVNSVSGDELRQDVSFTKMQSIILYYWSQKIWTVLAPEWYYDYVHDDLAMNLQGRLVYAPIKRINLWIQPGVGVFGDFAARYEWKAEAGIRYFFLRDTFFKRRKSG